MKKSGLFLFILLNVLFLQAQDHAQAKITGRVLDSASRTGIEYATITVYNHSSTKIITGTTTDVSGNFSVPDLSESEIDVLIESIGYKARRLNSIILSRKNAVVDLSEILLNKTGEILQDVVVTNTRGPIENKIDKLVYNAEKDLTSQGGVATDILKKVPQVSVDVDGNVQVAGASGIRFLINGKPSSAFGSNITDVLQSIPASQIKSIELVTNPGAKYDAQGIGGIINIILKQTKVKGINGSVSLTAGSRSENGSVNLNARRGNIGVGAFFSGNARLKAKTPNTSTRLSTDNNSGINTQLQQEGFNQFTRHGYQTGINFDWTVQKLNNFSGAMSYNDFGNNGTGQLSQSLITKQNGNPLSSSQTRSNSNSNFKFHNVDLSLGYLRKFKKEDRELELSFSSSNGRNRSMVNNQQVQLPGDSVFYGINSYNPSKEKETEFNIDFTEPVKEDVVLGVGGKISLYDINSASDVNSYRTDSKSYLPDAALTNSLAYHQKVYALYSEISFPVASLFQAKIGGRYERTELKSFYSNAQQQLQSPGYNTFVPSIFFSKKLNDIQTIKLSYSKRIERPDYEDLNPFINTSDPKNISAGNPYLRPEIGHRMEFSYTRNLKNNGSFMATAFYRINQDDIQPYIVYYPTLKVGDSLYNNVTVSTRQNIGSEKNAGINLFADIHPNEKLGLRSNLSFFQRHTVNALDPGFNSEGFNYRFNINSSYQFSKTLAAEAFGNFNSPRRELQGRYPSFTSYSFAIRKQFWNKKGSLAFTTSNPFGKYVKQETSVTGTNFSYNNVRQIPFRSVGLNFTWKFGKLEFKKDNEQNSAPQNSPVE
ncbi:MAG: TonB-dependent receptor [Ferruginibacter sp.]|nr:TonB-dependent receptor [Ferruginibacter sp.]